MSRTLGRIAKVLNQAENASTPAEAAAYMERAQMLASAASIDLAVARAHTINKEKLEQVEVDRSVQVNPHTRRTNNEMFMDLFLAVARVNDVQCTIGGSARYAFATGFPSDLEVTEALFGRLAVQMVADCDAALKAGANQEWRNVPKRIRVPLGPDEPRAWGQWDGSGYYDDWDGGNNPPPKTKLVDVRDDNGELVYENRQFSLVDARVYRTNFYAGFVHSTEIRLLKARQEARIKSGAEEVGSSTEVALRDKAKEVHDIFEEQVMGKLKKLNPRGLGSYKGAKVENVDYLGRDHGAEAARKVQYDDGNAVSSTNRKELS